MSVATICLTKHCNYIPQCNQSPNFTTNGREPYPENPLFERISYNTKNDKGKYYIIHHGIKPKPKLLYQDNAQLLDRVDGYYSIHDPDEILLLALTFKGSLDGGNTLYYTSSLLRSLGFGTNVQLSDPSFSLKYKEVPGNKVTSSNQITLHLTTENSRVNSKFKDKKIRITLEGNKKKNVREIERSIGDFSFISFIPEINAVLSLPGGYILPRNELFKDESKNKMDDVSFNRFNLKDSLYDLISVYYPNSDHSPLTSDHALLIELVSDGNKTYIRRKNLKGDKQWDSVRRRQMYSTNEQLANILKTIQYGLTNNIILILDKKTTYTKTEIGEITTQRSNDSQPLTTSVTPRNLSGTSYCYYEYYISMEVNSLPYLKDPIPKHLLKLELLPCIGNKRIILKDNGGSTNQHIYYKKGGNDKVYVYFYQHNSTRNGIREGTSCTNTDTVPLLFYSNNKWYSPQSKADYFNHWNEVSELKSIHGPSNGNNSKIKNQLDIINKMLNEIDISETNNYGIPWGFCKSSGFNPDRIKVQHEDIAKVYKKYTHSTINMFQIGNVAFTHQHNFQGNEIILENISYYYPSYSPNSVVAFFIKMDANLAYPLLICFGRDDKYNLYFELESITEINTYSYRKGDGVINLTNEKEIEKKLADVLNSLGKEDHGTLYKYLKFQDHKQYSRQVETLKADLSYNLMKTVIPLGGTYLMAGMSIYPASTFLRSFLAMI